MIGEMKQVEKITVESLDTNVKTALELLKKKKNKARLGIGFYIRDNCPIARAYCITAELDWVDLDEKDKDILKKEGWNSKIYEYFLHWYDIMSYRKEKQSFLKKFLR